MGRRRLSDETERHLKAVKQEFERVDESEDNGSINLDDYRKPRIGISPDKIILDALKCLMRKDDRFDYAEYRENLIDAE